MQHKLLYKQVENRETTRNLRWHVFKNFGADNMFKIVRQSVFEFIKHIGTGEESAYSRYMKSAIFLIPNARTLAKVIDGVDALDMKLQEIVDKGRWHIPFNVFFCKKQI